MVQQSDLSGTESQLRRLDEGMVRFGVVSSLGNAYLQRKRMLQQIANGDLIGAVNSLLSELSEQSARVIKECLDQRVRDIERAELVGIADEALTYVNEVHLVNLPDEIKFAQTAIRRFLPAMVSGLDNDAQSQFIEGMITFYNSNDLIGYGEARQLIDSENADAGMTAPMVHVKASMSPRDEKVLNRNWDLVKADLEKYLRQQQPRRRGLDARRLPSRVRGHVVESSNKALSVVFEDGKSSTALSVLKECYEVIKYLNCDDHDDALLHVVELSEGVAKLMSSLFEQDRKQELGNRSAAGGKAYSSKCQSMWRRYEEAVLKYTDTSHSQACEFAQRDLAHEGIEVSVRTLKDRTRPAWKSRER